MALHSLIKVLNNWLTAEGPVTGSLRRSGSARNKVCVPAMKSSAPLFLMSENRLSVDDRYTPLYAQICPLGAWEGYP